jgi:hypothetical protein
LDDEKWNNGIWGSYGKFLFLRKGEACLHRKIFRIMKYKHLIDMFENGHNTLIHPSKWSNDDPLEEYYLDTRQQNNTENKVLSFFGNIFCQCWSTRDGLNDGSVWLRHNTNQEDIVQIETTIFELIQSIDNIECINAMVGEVYYIDNLQYNNDYQVYQIPLPRIPFSKIMRGDIKDISKMMLIKRKWFSFEKEIRVICVIKDTHYNEKTKTYKIDVNKFIKNIVFGPFIDENQFNNLQDKIIKYSYDNNKILRLKIRDKIQPKVLRTYFS